MKGKKIAIFALPGAFTPTCSAKHVPSYLANFDKLKAKGVDEIWCISVNDAFVMGAWSRDQKAGGKIRFMADGSAEYTKKLGLTLDLTARGMGMRSNRYSMLVDDGVVKTLNVEGPGQVRGLRRRHDAEASLGGERGDALLGAALAHRVEPGLRERHGPRGLAAGPHALRRAAGGDRAARDAHARRAARRYARCRPRSSVPFPADASRRAARVLRTGKSTTHVESRIVNGEETLALVVGVFGLARESTVKIVAEQPAVDAGRAIEMKYVAGAMPAFTQHFKARWVKGGAPYTGATERDNVIELGIRDAGPVGEYHVVAMADFIPPIALSFLTERAPAASLTWMLEILVDNVGGLAPDGWRMDAHVMAARDGYTHQSLELWGPNGVLVALGRQTMVVFA